MWKLNNKFPNNQWVRKKKKPTKLEANENGNTICQNLWDAAKAVLRRMFTAINAYRKKKERSQMS